MYSIINELTKMILTFFTTLSTTSLSHILFVGQIRIIFSMILCRIFYSCGPVESNPLYTLLISVPVFVTITVSGTTRIRHRHCSIHCVRQLHAHDDRFMPSTEAISLPNEYDVYYRTPILFTVIIIRK